MFFKDGEEFKLPDIEERVLKFWADHDVFRRSVDARKEAKPFRFFEGPPTANGRPAIHHVLARAFKDVVLRYKTMRGYYVPRRAGWDTHGLPVELEVEKELGIKSKQEIEKFGIAQFNERAKASVWKYKDEWEKLTARVGFWLDFANPYVTYANDYVESLWWVFSQFAKKKLLKKSYKVVPWCPRCQTTLSSHELGQPGAYQLTKDPSVYVKFEIRNSKSETNSKNQTSEKLKTYLLVWTTTPWTLPANVAVAVNPKLTYTQYKVGGELLWSYDKPPVVNGVELEIVGRMSGRKLVGLQYEPFYDTKNQKNKKSKKQLHVVVAASFVETEQGTGLVHIAPAFGEDDFTIGVKMLKMRVEDIPMTVDEAGMVTADVPGKGKFIKQADRDILDDLRARGLLHHADTFEHEYPFCWRCSTPLLYFARLSWFVEMSRLRKKLLAENKKINWIPSHIQDGRFGEWLREVKDWAISRERYWGTPLPIWECEKCSAPRVVGSLADLDKFAYWSNKRRPLSEHNYPYNAQGELDVHRPYIDQIYLTCAKCKSRMRRVKEVADVWFDSGAMPYAQWHYPFENKDLVDSGAQYPADYIAEGMDQTRGWFYTLLAVAVALGRTVPYLNVISFGLLLDKNGQKMSKSKGNVVDPWAMFSKYGADVVRWHFYTINPPGEPKRFDEQDLLKASRRFFAIIYNSLVFLKTYGNVGGSKIEHQPSHVLDRWILARLEALVADVTTKLDAYEVGEAGRSIEGFVDDLSRWYIRRSRGRFREVESKKENVESGGRRGSDREQASATLRHILLRISKIIAPFTPFFAEALYQELRTHDARFAESVHLADFPLADETLIDAELIAQMDEVRRLATLGLAARASVKIKVRQPLKQLKVKSVKLKVTEELLKILKDEVNVKEIVFDAKIANEVELDTVITPELREEGLLREFVRIVQELRQTANYKQGERARLFAVIPPELQAVVEKNLAQFQAQTSLSVVEFKRAEKFDVESVTNFDGAEIWLAIRK